MIAAMTQTHPVRQSSKHVYSGVKNCL